MIGKIIVVLLFIASIISFVLTVGQISEQNYIGALFIIPCVLSIYGIVQLEVNYVIYRNK